MSEESVFLLEEEEEEVVGEREEEVSIEFELRDAAQQHN
jgi:hypothetical protein